MKRVLLPLVLAGFASCASESVHVHAEADLDPSSRAAMFDAVKGLEGTWQMDGAEGTALQIDVTSGGSVVRETMFPGTPNEMVNMYSLDGNSMVMTHYCAGGNQPHMRAASMDGGTIAFAPDGVSDLKATDAAYMASMTLVVVDDDHFEQHWNSLTPTGEAVEDHSMVFTYERVR